MHYTVIGVWLNNRPVVVGVIAGNHEVYGGDEVAFDEGMWFTGVNASDIAEAEQLAMIDIMENTV